MQKLRKLTVDIPKREDLERLIHLAVLKPSFNYSRIEAV